MKKADYNNSIALTGDIYWIGFYDEQAHLHCNPYLIVEPEEVILFDPGSIPHFPIIMRKIIEIVNPENISTIIVSHQDPDVCGNLAVMEDVINKADLKIVAHSNTLRLIRHYGLRSDLYCTDENDYKLDLKSGRTLKFIYTPYLHSPGSMATYDESSRSLFSSDLFGAISDDWSLYAEGDFLKKMGSFHKLYMPSNNILQKGLTPLEQLPLDRILPQHGSVLEKDQIINSFKYLKDLPCGIDLL